MSLERKRLYWVKQTECNILSEQKKNPMNQRPPWGLNPRPQG